MLPQEIIRSKRDGNTLTEEQIAFFVKGITQGYVTDGQVAAFAMAVYFNGMNLAERVALTRHMMSSGSVLNWKDLDLPGPIVDKHSTGGVSDSVSLMLGPMVAACGGFVPMISGRGLGHTGGTLDKFESIRGYNTSPDMQTFRKVVKDTGVAIIGQTSDLAPADKRFYGIRDVTATVDSMPLITASILSKKLAAGLDALAMDVKAGNGAFMATLDDATGLAESIVKVANQAGVKTSAVITDMNQPLGSTAGNAVEMLEAVDYLTGKQRNPRLHEVTMALSAQMLTLTGLAQNESQALDKLQAVLDNGLAAETFARMVHTLGGPVDFIDNPWSAMEKAPVTYTVEAPASGFITSVATRDIGLIVVELGGGRTNPADPVDHAVGLTNLPALGDHVEAGQPLATIHARTDTQAHKAAEALVNCLTIAEQKPQPIPVVYSSISPEQALSIHID